MLENLDNLPKSVVDTYYLANTPSFLYRVLRENSYIQLLANNDAEELINAFKEMASKPISSIQEMALAYAILVALSFKEIQEVNDFFAYVKTIKFEWFSDIAKLYLGNYKPAPLFQSIQIDSTPQQFNSIINLSSDIIYSK